MPLVGPTIADPFASESAPSGRLVGPVLPDPFAEEGPGRTLGGHLGEVGPGIASGAVGAVGTGLRGAAANIQPWGPRYAELLAEIERADIPEGVTVQDLEARFEAEPSPLDAITGPRPMRRAEPGNPLAALDEAIRFADIPNEKRTVLRRALRARIEGRPEPLAAAYAGRASPVRERRLWRAGEAVSGFAEETFPAAPGYEGSPVRAVSEGLGSLATGVAVSAAGGPNFGPVLATTLFANMGAGEAADRAVEAGASDEQIAQAALLGLGAGSTDVLPVEVLLRRLPVPGARAVGDAVRRFGGAKVLGALGRIGTQAAVEAVQEGGQQALQNLIAREVHSPDQRIGEGIVPAAGVGGGVGGIAGLTREGILAIANRRSGSARGARARAVADVPPPSPGDEASPIPTADIQAGREEVADAQATEAANAWLATEGLPAIGQPVRIARGRELVEGVVTDAWDDGGGGITVTTPDGTVMDASLAELDTMGARVEVLTMPPGAEEIEAVEAERAKEADGIARFEAKMAERAEREMQRYERVTRREQPRPTGEEAEPPRAYGVDEAGVRRAAGPSGEAMQGALAGASPTARIEPGAMAGESPTPLGEAVAGALAGAGPTLPGDTAQAALAGRSPRAAGETVLRGLAGESPTPDGAQLGEALAGLSGTPQGTALLSALAGTERTPEGRLVQRALAGGSRTLDTSEVGLALSGMAGTPQGDAMLAALAGATPTPAGEAVQAALAGGTPTLPGDTAQAALSGEAPRTAAEAAEPTRLTGAAERVPDNLSDIRRELDDAYAEVDELSKRGIAGSARANDDTRAEWLGDRIRALQDAENALSPERPSAEVTPITRAAPQDETVAERQQAIRSILATAKRDRSGFYIGEDDAYANHVIAELTKASAGSQSLRETWQKLADYRENQREIATDEMDDHRDGWLTSVLDYIEAEAQEFEPEAAAVQAAPIVRANGEPFKTRQGAVLAARNKRIEDAEPVRVSGGWALRRAGPREARVAQALRVLPETRSESFTPDGESAIETELAVVDAADLIVSHDEQGRPDPRYPAELQPRERDRATSQLQIRQMAGRLQPGMLGASPMTDTGAPIVGPDGAVESGNGRAAAIRLAYRRQMADGYRAMVEDEAERAGLDVSDMDAPILVRVRQGGTSADERTAFARQSNVSAAARMSASERAKADVETAGRGVLEEYATNPARAMGRFIESLPASERTAMFDADGRPSRELEERVRNAVLWQAYGSDSILRAAAETSDPDSKQLLNALTTAAPQFAEVQDGVKTALNAAVDRIATARARGMNNAQVLEQVVGQHELLDDTGGFDDGAREIAKGLMSRARSGKRLGEYLVELAERAERAEASRAQGGVDLFGEVPEVDVVTLARQADDATAAPVEIQGALLQRDERDPGTIDAFDVGADERGALERLGDDDARVRSWQLFDEDAPAPKQPRRRPEPQRDPYTRDAFDPQGSLFQRGEFADSANSRRRDVPPGRVRIRLSRNFDTARTGVRRDIERTGRAVFGDRFHVQLAERIEAPDGGAVPGAFDPEARIAYIAIRANEAGMTGTLFHEGLHYLRAAGAFSRADGTPNAAWQTLERQAAQWRKDYGIDERYGADTAGMDPDARERLMNEEAIAEALADYATRGRETGFSATVRMAFDRILRFFRQLANGLRGRGFKTWEDIFEDIEGGAYGRAADAAGRDRATRRAEVDRYLQAAWHGSPHRFDKFSTGAMGTGEGNQAYGWGLYFSGKREVAEWYRRNLSSSVEVRVRGQPLEEAIPRNVPTHRGQVSLRMMGSKLASGVPFAEAKAKALRQAEDYAAQSKLELTWPFEGMPHIRESLREDVKDWNAVREFVEGLQEGDVTATRGGATYRVDLAPAEDEYLLWDEPLSGQSAKVRDFARWFFGEGMEARLRALGDESAPGLFDRYPRESIAIRGVGRFSVSRRPNGRYNWVLIPWDTRNWAEYRRTHEKQGSLNAALRAFRKITSNLPDMTGEQFYTAVTDATRDKGERAGMGAKESASRELLAGGVRGIKYLDGSSRGRGEGTYNYVIFDDADVAIDEVLLQRPPLTKDSPKADKEAFDADASKWAGADLRGAADAVIKDKARMGGLAENIRAQLKGADAIKAKNVEVQEQLDQADLNVALRMLAPPAAWSKKFPAVHKLVRAGIRGEIALSNRVQRLNREWDRITKGLSKDEFADLTGMMFLGDAEAHTFTDAELAQFPVTDNVRRAYRRARRFIDKLGRVVEQHNRAMSLSLLQRRTKLVRKMAGARGMDPKAFRTLYDERARLLAEQRQGAGDPEALAERIDAATERLHGTAEPSAEYTEWAAEADRIQPRIDDTRIRRREGYVPHKFFGRWRVFREVPEDEARTALGFNGQPFRTEKAARYASEANGGGEVVEVEGGYGYRTRWQHVAGEHGFWRTRTEAVRAASNMAKDGSRLRVAQVQFVFPEDQATQLSDAAYHRFQGNVGKLLGLEGEDLREAVRGTARKRFRRRIAGFAQYRKGVAGYSQDLDRVIRTHIGETMRYVSLDRLKFDAINTMEREGLSENRSTVQDRPVLAAAVQQWFRDVNGQKQVLEGQVDQLLNRPWATPLRGALGAGGLTFVATHAAGAPLVAPVLGAYVGWRVGRGLAQGGPFPSRAITGAMLGDMSHLKLGMTFNLMSAAVNTTQVLLNTYPVLGARHTGVGVKRFNKAVLSKLRGKPNADWRAMERHDISPLANMAEGTRHQFQKEGKLSKLSMIWFTGAESFNRGVTFLGALNRAQGEGKTAGEAQDYANAMMLRTQFHYGASNKPELLRNNFARVPLQFKNFVAQQLTFVFGLSRSELPRFLLSTVLVAGALGIPGLDALDALMDWLFDFSPIAAMKGAAIDALSQGELAGGVATFITRGVPGLAGVDMTGRVGMGDKFLPLQVRDWKGAWWSTVENAVRHGAEGARLVDHLRNVSPGVGNPLKTLEEWQGGGVQRSPWKRNRPEYTMTGPEAAMKAIGARPMREARSQDLRDIERREVERRRREVRRFVDRIVEAERAGDRAEVRRIQAQAREAGVPLSKESIRRAFRDIETPRAERELRQLPRDMRGEGWRRRQAIEQAAGAP